MSALVAATLAWALSLSCGPAQTQLPGERQRQGANLQVTYQQAWGKQHFWSSALRCALGTRGPVAGTGFSSLCLQETYPPPP